MTGNPSSISVNGLRSIPVWGKGVTLSKEEMQMILDTMANFDENADEMPIEPMDEF